MSPPESFWKAYIAEPKYSSGSTVARLCLPSSALTPQHGSLPHSLVCLEREQRQIGQRGAARKGLLHGGGSLGAVTAAQPHRTSAQQGWADSTASWQGVEWHPEAGGRDKTKDKDTTQVQGPARRPRRDWRYVLLQHSPSREQSPGPELRWSPWANGQRP